MLKGKVMTKANWIALFVVANTFFAATESVQAQEPYLGEIRMFAGNFAPRGWALCDGQLLAVNQNDALFSLLGTMYGGDGRTTFGVPDLRGRVPMHAGTGPGLTQKRLGQKGGSEVLTLLARKAVAKAQPGGDVEGVTGKQQISTYQPYTVVNFIIAVQGIYPSRN